MAVCERNINDLTKKILSCAYEVHTRLGPGLLESTYRTCLAHCLRRVGLNVEAEVPIAISFDDLAIPAAYRADLIVDETVLLELKATDQLVAVHSAQTRTYLIHSSAAAALLINFNVQRLVQGIRRFDRTTAWNGSGKLSPRTLILPALPTQP